MYARNAVSEGHTDRRVNLIQQRDLLVAQRWFAEYRPVAHPMRYRITGRGIVTGEIRHRWFFNEPDDAFRHWQDLPHPWIAPMWCPSNGEPLEFEFATLQFVVTTSASNQTYTSVAGWNNANNSVEVIAGGGAGISSGAAGATGSGGGAGYSKIVNFVFASPGTTTATFRLEAAATVGNAGKDCWFNDTAYPSSGNGKVAAKGGGVGLGTSAGIGGAAASGYAINSDGGTTGVAKFSGGNSGVGTAGGWSAGGAGGAGGPSGNGAIGGNSENNGSSSAGGGGGGNGGGGAGQVGVAGVGGAGGTRGGGAAGGTGGAGGNINSNAVSGVAGQDWDATHGSGGGGGGGGASGGNGGAGGGYGAGGGSGSFNGGTGASGAQAIIVLTYTAAGGPSGRSFGMIIG
jgi:hypothetical protein